MKCNYATFVRNHVSKLMFEDFARDQRSLESAWDVECGKRIPLIDIELRKVLMRVYIEESKYIPLLIYCDKEFRALDIDDFPHNEIIKRIRKDRNAELSDYQWSIVLKRPRRAYAITRLLWNNFNKRTANNSEEDRIEYEKTFLKCKNDLFKTLQEYLSDLALFKNKTKMESVKEEIEKVKMNRIYRRKEK